MESWKSQLERGHEWLCEQLGVEADRYPLRFAPGNDGWLQAEETACGFCDLIVTERGSELSREHAETLSDALYIYARPILGQEGSRHAASRPAPGSDQRRISFAFQLDTIGQVCPDWRDRLATEQEAVLARHPYSDDPEPNRRGWLGVLVVAALIALWAAAHWPLWAQWQLQSDLAANGVSAEARVVELSETDGKFADSWRVEYKFAVGEKTHVNTDEIWIDEYWRLKPRSTVPIRYDPADPTRAMVEGNDRFSRLAWIWGLIDALLVFILLRGWRRLRRQAGQQPQRT